MQELLVRALTEGPAPVLVCAPDETVIFASDAAGRMLGIDPVGRRLRDLVTGDLRDRWVTVNGTHLADGHLVVEVRGAGTVTGFEAERDRLEWLTTVGDWRSMRARTAEVFADPELARRSSLAYLNLSNFKIANDRFGHEVGDEVLRLASRLLRLGTPDAVWVSRTGGDEFACLFPGHGADAGAAVLEAVAARFAEEVPALVADAPVRLYGGIAALGESANESTLRADAAAYQARVEGADSIVVHGPVTEAWHAERRRLASQVTTLQAAALTDALTALPNRRALEVRFAGLDARPASYAVLFVDADRFGALNHHRGDAAGDDALRVLATVLREGARSADGVFRKGGEEFVVVLPGADADEARVVGERLRAAVQARGVPHGGAEDTPVLTVTIGVATRGEGDGSREVCDRAAAAAYASKTSGRRNTVAAAASGART